MAAAGKHDFQASAATAAADVDLISSKDDVQATSEAYGRPTTNREWACKEQSELRELFESLRACVSLSLSLSLSLFAVVFSGVF